MKIVSIICFACIAFCYSAQAQFSSRAFDVIHYDFSLSLSDTSNLISGESTVTVRFPDTPPSHILLDLVGASSPQTTGMRVRQTRINHQTVPFTHIDNRLSIPTNEQFSPEDTISITIQYDGTPADGLAIGYNRYNQRTFFGDNWPDRAQHWLPVVDHPSDKASCTFSISAPAHYRVVSNGTLQEESPKPNGYTLTRWHQPQPIATKVMVVGVAPLAYKHTGLVKGIPVSSWVFPENKEKAFLDLDIAPDVLRFFTDRLGTYPYDKLTHIQSKTRWGGMENASAIFYTEGAFTGLQNMERIIAHETAHQWFGNSTTEADWPHIWLSEGFATYLTHLYIEHTHGRAVMENDMAKDKQKILAFINRHPESAIVEHNIENINFLINANSYEKAGWVLHMLRHETGDAHFWNILKTYLEKYRHNNAETKDFVTIVNRITGNKYDWFFDQWLYRPGIPTVSYTWTYEKNKITIQFEQQGTPFLLPIDIQLKYASGEKRKLKTGIAENKETIVIKSKEKPTAILLDPDHWLLARLQPSNP